MPLDFTFIILTHERKRYLEKMLSYYEQDQNINFKILICDTSKTEYNLQINKNIFQYFHFPNLSYIEKISKILKMVKTKYVLLGTDDDYFIIKNFQIMLNKLNSTPKANSIDGRIITFNKELEILPEGLHTRKCLLYDDPLVNLTTYMKEFFPIYYSIIKTDVIIDIFKTIQKYRITNLYLYEHVFAVISLIRGKHIHNETFFSARDISSPPTLVESRGEENRIDKQYENNTIQYRKFLIIISRELERILIDKDYSYCKQQAFCIIKKDLIHNFLYNRERYYDVQKSKSYQKIIKRIFQIFLPKELSEKIFQYHWKQRVKVTINRTINLPGFPFYDTPAVNEWNKIKQSIDNN